MKIKMLEDFVVGDKYAYMPIHSLKAGMVYELNDFISEIVLRRNVGIELEELEELEEKEEIEEKEEKEEIEEKEERKKMKKYNNKKMNDFQNKGI